MALCNRKTGGCMWWLHIHISWQGLNHCLYKSHEFYQELKTLICYYNEYDRFTWRSNWSKFTEWPPGEKRKKNKSNREDIRRSPKLNAAELSMAFTDMDYGGMWPWHFAPNLSIDWDLNSPSMMPKCDRDMVSTWQGHEFYKKSEVSDMIQHDTFPILKYQRITAHHDLPACCDHGPQKVKSFAHNMNQERNH